MLLVGWEPLPSLRTLRARAAYANASREQVGCAYDHLRRYSSNAHNISFPADAAAPSGSVMTCSPVLQAAPSTDVIVGEPSPSLGILQQPEKQSVDLKTAASSSNLLHKEEAFSPSCALADAARSGLTRPENLHQPAEMLRQQPQHKPGLSTELDQESQEPALEEGELPEGEEQLSGSGPDERVEDTLHNQQSAAEVTESAAAPAAKRKRGERAGKRVRQRQAKRAREMELGILPDEARHKQVPKRLTGKKRLPTCKYVLPTQSSQHYSVQDLLWFLHLPCSCSELFFVQSGNSACMHTHSFSVQQRLHDPWTQHRCLGLLVMKCDVLFAAHVSCQHQCAPYMHHCVTGIICLANAARAASVPSHTQACLSHATSVVASFSRESAARYFSQASRLPFMLFFRLLPAWSLAPDHFLLLLAVQLPTQTPHRELGRANLVHLCHWLLHQSVNAILSSCCCKHLLQSVCLFLSASKCERLMIHLRVQHSEP